MCSSRRWTAMEVCKTKTFLADLSIFHTYLDIFGYLLALSGTFQAYSGPCIDLIYSEPCYGMLRTRGSIRTLVYSELCYIQTLGIFRTSIYSEPYIFRAWGILRTLAYYKTWHTEKLRHTQNPVKNLRWSVLGNQLTNIIIFPNYILQYELFLFSTLWNKYHAFFLTHV